MIFWGGHHPAQYRDVGHITLFGFSLFVMKQIAPPNTSMEDIYLAALPFLGCDLIAMTLIIVFPTLASGCQDTFFNPLLFGLNEGRRLVMGRAGGGLSPQDWKQRPKKYLQLFSPVLIEYFP